MLVFCFYLYIMKISVSQKRINDRRQNVSSSYKNLIGELTTSVIVKSLAEKHGVSEVTIWGDLKIQGCTTGKPRKITKL